MAIPDQSRSPSNILLPLFAWVEVHTWPRIAVTLVLMAAALHAGEGATPVGEYQLKALFLFNFTGFVEWPSQAFGDAREPFTICVVGENPFGASLDDAVRGKTAANRPISIQLVSTPQQARKCHILFVSASERKAARGLFDALMGASVLTVSDAPGFAANGGIVQLNMKDSRVRFEINADAAERARLRISSKLLSLADPPR